MHKCFFFGGLSLLGDHTIDLKTSTKASKVISSYTSEFTPLNNSHSNSREPSFSSSRRGSRHAKASLKEMKSHSPHKFIYVT